MVEKQLTQVDKCRACLAPIQPLFSLGELYVSDFPLPKSTLGPKEPLDLYKCTSCQLVQLGDNFERDRLFRHFWYESGLSPMMKNQLQDISNKAQSLVKLEAKDTVLDIGSNDGTLLKAFPNVNKVGFEPAINLNAKGNGSFTVFPEYFDGPKYLSMFPRAKVITAIAMFYDIAEPNKFLEEVEVCLKDNGVFIVQMNYLPSMLLYNCYDNIVHEHLCYYSMGSFETLLHRHGLEAFNVLLNNVNGGSFRCYIGKIGERPVAENVTQLIMREQSMGLDRAIIYRDFFDRIKRQRARLFNALVGLKNHRRKVYAYGTGTRGNTILQFSNISGSLVQKACDANPEKHGRMTIGTNIPIISKEEARKDRPDYFLILPYHFKDEILEAEKDFLDTGGSFIVPLPELTVIDKTSIRTHN